MVNLSPRWMVVLLGSVMLVPLAHAADTCVGTANADLCAMTESGRLSDLRWPNFIGNREQIKDFYQAANYAPAWVNQSHATPPALAMIRLFQAAEKQGLRPEDYDASRWDARLQRFALSAPPPTDADVARFDLALTVCAMRYISDLHNGRVSPRFFEFGLDVKHRQYNLSEFLRPRVIDAVDIEPVIAEVEPPYEGYRRTKAALEHYLALAKQGDGEPLPRVKKTVKPGDSYPGVLQLTQRLQLLGDLAVPTPTPVAAPAVTPTPASPWQLGAFLHTSLLEITLPATAPTAVPAPSVAVAAPSPSPAPQSDVSLYEGAVVEAVKHFQMRHGLPADGALDAATFRELTVPLNRRVRQLQFALERWRWLPPDLQQRHVVVNIPAFQLYAYDGENLALTMKVVTGQAFHEEHLDDHQTPLLEDEMEYVIFHPYWNVPSDIAEKEIVPSVQKDASFLAKHQYDLVNKDDVVVIPETFDAAVAKQIADGDLSVRQQPGAGNALGPIKFVFPNHYDVYFHGTPEQKLFARSRRDFSHGCVRLENPAALAQWVLRDDPSWTMDRIQATMKEDPNKKKKLGRTPEVKVLLPQPIPVLILYQTASVEEDGQVHFFNDIYGHDTKMEHALAVYPHVPVLPPSDRPHVHVDEVRTAVVANPAPAQPQSSVP